MVQEKSVCVPTSDKVEPKGDLFIEEGGPSHSNPVLKVQDMPLAPAPTSGHQSNGASCELFATR